MNSPKNPHATSSRALIESLLESPLLVGDLPNAAQFERRFLTTSADPVELNFDQKLGHLYEDALASLLVSSPGIELVEQNLQIRTDIHTTVGELDFLVRQTSGRLVHLELATKFYLAIETENGFAFPGPDARDNYDRKIKRLLSHQLTLVERYRSHLPVAYRDEAIEVKQLIFGCLFDHISQTEPSRPRLSNPECRRGTWLRHNELADHFSSDVEFNLIPKHLWPVSIELLENIPLETWQPYGPVTRCVMLRIEGRSIPYFIAPDDYPAQS